MRAIVQNRYGGPEVLRLEEVADPVPDDHQVLIRVQAAAANPWDWHFMRGEPYVVHLISGLGRPRGSRIIGSDMAGIVEAVGRNVTGYQRGDEVFAMVGDGGFAELIARDALDLVPKPRNMSFAEAAGVPLAAMTALQAVRDHGRLEAGRQVMITGASGGVGSFAVQMAQALGAEVTGVCSARNAELVRSLGADHVIDYQNEDYTDGSKRYDVIIDNVGLKRISDWRRALAREGTLVAVAGLQPIGNWVGPFTTRIKLRHASWSGSQRLVDFMMSPRRVDLMAIREMIEKGEVRTIVDREYPLASAAEAIAHLEEGHARGKVIVSI